MKRVTELIKMINNHHLGLRRPAQHSPIEDEYFREAFWGIRRPFNAVAPSQPLELAHWKIALGMLFLVSRESWDACSLQPSHGYYFVEGMNPCSRRWDRALVREEREARTGAWNHEMDREQRERDERARARRSSGDDWRETMRRQDPDTVFSIIPAPRERVERPGWREIMNAQDPTSVFSIEPGPSVGRNRSEVRARVAAAARGSLEEEPRARRDRSAIRAPAAAAPSGVQEEESERACEACLREMETLRRRCRRAHWKRE